MQKVCLLLFLFLFAQKVFSQESNKKVRLQTAIQQLDSALVQTDTTVLARLFLPQFTFGHSNAMIQGKATALADAISGKLRYSSITALKKPAFTLVENVGSVRREIAVAGSLSGNAFDLKLSVLELWLYQRKSWKLLSRQSAKLPE